MYLQKHRVADLAGLVQLLARSTRYNLGMDSLSAAGFMLGVDCFFAAGRGIPTWLDFGEFQFHCWTARQMVYEKLEMDRCRVEAMRRYVSGFVDMMHKRRGKRIRRRDRAKDEKAASESIELGFDSENGT